jgi:hypothetical protein
MVWAKPVKGSAAPASSKARESERTAMATIDKINEGLVELVQGLERKRRECHLVPVRAAWLYLWRSG